MNKIPLLFVAILLAVSLYSCGLQKNYNALQQAYDELEANSSEWLEYSENERVAKLAQSEADRIAAEEAEKKAKEKQKTARKAEKEAAAQKAEEEARKGYETGITFDNLARNPNDFKGQKVKFTGEVLQVIEGDDEVDIRLSTRQDQYGHYFEDVVYLYVLPINVTSRILKGDVITIYGVSDGLYTYTSTSDIPITLPLIEVDKYDFVKMN